MHDESLLKLKIPLRVAASEVAIEITPAWQSGWDYTSRMRGSLGRGSS